MGSIGGLLGVSGGQSGTGIAKPGSVPLATGVTTDQTNQAYNQTQGGLGSQQALLAALQAQGGIGNQSSVFNQNQAIANQMAGASGIGNQARAIDQQQMLNSQLAGSGGLGAQQNAITGLQDVAGQQGNTLAALQGIANGTGPNLAQATLNQATGQNVANQAALMAGQRGAGSNVGLLAREAAQQGAATQQNAVGQGAVMQAQQQLGALGQQAGVEQGLAGTQQALAGIGQGLVGQQQTGIGAQANQAGAQVQQQLAQQQALAQQAAGQVGQLAGANTAYNQTALGQQGQLLGGIAAQNNANVGMQSNINSANAGLAGKQLEGQQNLVGGLINAGGGAAMAAAAGARGGEVSKMADGGTATLTAPDTPVQGPVSSFGQFLHGWSQNMTPQGGDSGPQPFQMGGNQGAQEINKGLGKLGQAAGIYLNRPSAPPPGASAGPDFSEIPADIASTAARGGLAKAGGNVAAKKPSQKATKAGNSYDNDKVPAMLSEGEVVLPRSVMQSGDPVRSAADFVAKVMAKRGRK